MTERFYTYVCRHCGSEDVSQDAWADFNPVSQQNELRTDFDDSFCHACEGETKVEEQEITDHERIEEIRQGRRTLRAERNAEALLDMVERLVGYRDNYPSRGSSSVELFADAQELIKKIEG